MINIARNKLDTRAVEDNRVGSDGWRWVRLRFGGVKEGHSERGNI